MEESRNGLSDTDNINRATEIFERISGHMEKASNRGMVWERFVPSTVTSGTDGLSHEQAVASRENEDSVQQHLISSVVYRWIETHSGGEWELENIWDNVGVRQLDEIGQKPTREWRPVNYSGQENICIAMAENVNIVLLRSTNDWSRLDGNVWSQQVVWSGSFADSHRILQLMEDDSNAANSVELRVECFDLHPHLRERYIGRQGSYPLAAAMATVDSCPTVAIPVQSVGTGDGDDEVDISSCPICLDTLSTGDETKRLPCNHMFHGNCILQWFYSKFECPICRKEFQREIPSTSTSS